LFLSPLSFRETDKAVLIGALAVVGAIAWLSKLFLEAKTPSAGVADLWRAPLVLPLVLLAACYGVRTVVSIAPRMSLLGAYERGQGLIALCSYLTFFLLVRQELKTPAQWERLRFGLLLTSVPVSLYAILQRVGRDPFSFSSRFLERSSSTMGNPIFLGAYLA